MRKFGAVITFTSTSKTRCSDTLCELKNITAAFDFVSEMDEIDKNAFESWLMKIEKKIEDLQTTFTKICYKIDFSDSSEKNPDGKCVVHTFKSLDLFAEFLAERELIAPGKAELDGAEKIKHSPAI